MKTSIDVGGSHHYFDYDTNGELVYIGSEYDHDLAEQNYYAELEAR